ncbi:MAG TPA: cytochrome c peroxidase [Vicinamibacterales bacterium]|nr:cytochrome c peroxidase [Vicinamibacterales bacterium]
MSREVFCRWLGGAVILAVGVAACGSSPREANAPAGPPWEIESPIQPLKAAPLGMEVYFEDVEAPPPARVRLGRWLFYDTRLSADNTVACATCHKPEHAFSEITPVSTGVGGQKGTRKAPTFINRAVTLAPHFFWDGRAGSLEDQVLGPVANPIEMGNTHEAMIQTLSRVPGYTPYFKEAFGTEAITKERVAQAIADYERTRVSGNSPYDRWRFNHEQNAVSAEAKRGHDLFFDTAGCSQCHVGSSFSDSLFHNLGVGWDERTRTFKDEGRFAVSKKPEDRGAFKTPVLRDVSKHPPYMHDGSIATLKEVVELYNKGGIANPYLTRGRIKPLALNDADVNAIVAFLQSLDGEGYQDTPPKTFPQ